MYGVVEPGGGERETVKSELRRRNKTVLIRDGKGGEDEAAVLEGWFREDEGRLAWSQIGERGKVWDASREVVIWVRMSEVG